VLSFTRCRATAIERGCQGGDDLARHKHAPFPTSADSLFVAYYASADLGCFLALGWPMPASVLDLFAEYRIATNGLSGGASLLDALIHYGLGHIDAADKDAMRRLVMDQGIHCGS
jgi:DNA polymerase-1